jgi:hypothetical protein
MNQSYFYYIINENGKNMQKARPVHGIIGTGHEASGFIFPGLIKEALINS